jgi:hydrogen peroxide-dependent heme synthase
MTDPAPRVDGKRAKALNQQLRYSMWSVFRLAQPLPAESRDEAAGELDKLTVQLTESDVTTRGFYDVSGFRADAEIMAWWVAPTADATQSAYQRFRHTTVGLRCTPVWSQLALHRPAEFNKSHIPAFLADEAPKNYVCVYPFVRSYEWYLLPDTDRRAMLAEHGRLAREYPDVRANTVAAFALGDYEWMLAFEADDLHRIVDLMRHLRAAEARLHTRAETPFYTGIRREPQEIVARLP